MHRHITKLIAPTFRLQLNWLLLMAFVVAQLQLPIPVLHSHDRVDSSDLLSLHVTQRHALDQNLPEGMHWHWVLPCHDLHDDEDHERNGESDQSLPTPTTPNEQAVVVSNMASPLGFIGTHFMCETLDLSAPALSFSKTDRRFESDVSTVDPATFACAVLCVIRC